MKKALVERPGLFLWVVVTVVPSSQASQLPLFDRAGYQMWELACLR